MARRTRDVETSWSCDRCLKSFPLSLAQRRYIASTGPEVPLPLRRFEHRRGHSFTTFLLCPVCEPIADPDDPLDEKRQRLPGDTRLLLRPGGRAVQSVVATTPPQSVPKLELGPAELAYAARARSANTVKGYRSDWAEWTAWCSSNGVDPMPADPIAMSKYLAELARHGARVGTMSRRLSAIRFAEQAAGVTSRLDDGIVASVWEGIRRTHGAPPEQSLPIMPPLLWAMLDATPLVLDDGRASLAGLRDHTLLLVGFVGALRRSEIVAINVEHLEPHEKGLVLHIPRSKVNQTGENDELVVLPASTVPGRCPVAAILAWRHAAGIASGPLLRGVTKGGTPRPSRMNDSSINLLVKAAVARAGADPAQYSAHGLRAGFVTYANLMGQPDRSIARQTRHRSVASIAPYVRIQDAWQGNAAVELRL